MGDRGQRLRSWVDSRTIQPPPRLVDWSLFVLICFEVASGLLSFTVGRPEGWDRYVFPAHRIAGLTFVILLGYKLHRVRYRLANRDQWRPSTLLSALTAVAALGAVGTGVLWVTGAADPDARIAYWTLLSVHVGFGLALVPLVVAHLSTRFRRPRRVDFRDRRTAIRFAGLFVTGAVVYRGQELFNALLETGGDDRRFTGSRPAGSDGRDDGTGDADTTGNAGFPVTSWVADDPAPIARDSWSLTVRGLVERPLEIGLALDADGDGTSDRLELASVSDTERRALLDCTSGWYTIQEWCGARVGDILERASVTEAATHVRFVSVTGYRWTLPIDEARDALLATHVGGEPLSHGHGAPLRLVAPGRRGFQWVKWIERIDVRDRRDPAQWVVTLVSGLDLESD
ncbi:molybdopterin-dependent oxidoreductase [Halomontanus rarus]|uniref:molybdopterin-dependent oxidoreductase n=1 Tax=Halomontanus rarus TaxID=3034020 RepID=UPI001A980F90